MINNVFEWHEKTLFDLLAHRDRLPHAILLSGAEGGGKRLFALALAARLLCEAAAGATRACGTCPSCRWFAAGSHPDFRLVEPGGGDGDPAEDADEPATAPRKRSEQIRIDQVRELDDFLNVGSHRGMGRVIVITPAEAMNSATANALLKVLEEPNPSTLFLLVSNTSKRLLPTIRSRCRCVSLPRPDAGQARSWLRENGVSDPASLLAHAGGMPMMAVREKADEDRLRAFLDGVERVGQMGVLALAAEFESWMKEGKAGGRAMDKRTLVAWLQKWVFDLVALKLGGPSVYHPGHETSMRALVAGTSVSGLIDCYNELLRIRAVAQHPLNPRLFLEDMLSRYARAVAGRR